MTVRVPRVVRHDKSGAFVLHDRKRFEIVWDATGGALAKQARREHYVWVERGEWDDLARPRLLLFDERGQFLGNAAVASAWVAKADHSLEDMAELAD